MDETFAMLYTLVVILPPANIKYFGISSSAHGASLAFQIEGSR
jgi:hypothetical protein